MSSALHSRTHSTCPSPHVQYSPLRTPLLEPSQVPQPSCGPPSSSSPPSSCCHVHIHSHSHFSPLAAEGAAGWVLTTAAESASSSASSSPSSQSPPFPFTLRTSFSSLRPSHVSARRRLCAAKGGQCSASVAFKLLLAACLAAALLLYHAHLCAVADSQPESALSFLHTAFHQHKTGALSAFDPLLSLSQLSAVRMAPFLSSAATDFLLDPWQSRLLPVSVEMEAGMAWLQLSLVLLTGAADAQPVYAGLPCLRTGRPQHDDDDDDSNCEYGSLHLNASGDYVVVVTPLQNAGTSTDGYSALPAVHFTLTLSPQQSSHLAKDLPAQLRAEATSQRHSAA